MYMYMRINLPIYMYIHICMCVCVFVYMYTHTHTHTHTHILICANHMIYGPNFLFFQYAAPQACIRIAGYWMMRKSMRALRVWGVYWDEEEDTCRRVLNEEEDTLSRCIRVAEYWMRAVYVRVWCRACMDGGGYVCIGVWGAGCRRFGLGGG